MNFWKLASSSRNILPRLNFNILNSNHLEFIISREIQKFLSQYHRCGTIDTSRLKEKFSLILKLSITWNLLSYWTATEITVANCFIIFCPTNISFHRTTSEEIAILNYYHRIHLVHPHGSRRTYYSTLCQYLFYSGTF